MYLQIDLPHAFVYGDGLGVRYVSRLGRLGQAVYWPESASRAVMLGVVVLFGGVRASTCPLAPKLFHRRAAESAGVSDEGR